MLQDSLLINDFNTTFELTGPDGRRKNLWQENRLGRMIRLAFRHEFRIPFLTGNPTLVMVNHNLVTNAGHAAANARISGQGSYNPFVNIAIGTGTNAASATDTALQTEITSGGGQRGAATASQETTTVTNDTTKLVKTFTFSEAFAVTEEGILDAATLGGTLLARQTFAAVNVASGDSLTVTHTYQS
jgi:hypothetical protein